MKRAFLRTFLRNGKFSSRKRIFQVKTADYYRIAVDTSILPPCFIGQSNLKDSTSNPPAIKPLSTVYWGSGSIFRTFSTISTQFSTVEKKNFVENPTSFLRFYSTFFAVFHSFPKKAVRSRRLNHPLACKIKLPASQSSRQSAGNDCIYYAEAIGFSTQKASQGSFPGRPAYCSKKTVSHYFFAICL